MPVRLVIKIIRIAILLRVCREVKAKDGQAPDIVIFINMRYFDHSGRHPRDRKQSIGHTGILYVPGWEMLLFDAACSCREAARTQEDEVSLIFTTSIRHQHRHNILLPRWTSLGISPKAHIRRDETTTIIVSRGRWHAK
jgi:hypothetical protein